MPMGTLSLPSCLIDAAKGYADRENLSLADLFARMLHCQYGYVMTVAVARPKRKELRISPRVRALRGVAKLDGTRPYREIVAEELESKYEAIGRGSSLTRTLSWIF